MKINPYLNFDGQCKAAFEFYAQCLGGKIVFMQTHGDSPMAEHTPPDWHDRILHAQLAVGDMVLMASDTPPGSYNPPQGLYLLLAVETTDEAERIFQRLAENGSVQMPIAETFWAARYGLVTDQYGTPWMINCDHPA
jgi:PhnB protein